MKGPMMDLKKALKTEHSKVLMKELKTAQRMESMMAQQKQKD